MPLSRQNIKCKNKQKRKELLKKIAGSWKAKLSRIDKNQYPVFVSIIKNMWCAVSSQKKVAYSPIGGLTTRQFLTLAWITTSSGGKQQGS